MDVPDYSLPPEAIAQEPAEPREAARLLVALDRGDPGGGVDPGGRVQHRRVADLPDLLGPGDLLVVNTSRVLPARLRLHKSTGGAAEVLLLEPEGDEGPTSRVWVALVRPGRRLRPGTVLLAGDRPVVEVGPPLGEHRRQVRLLADGESVAELLAAVGTVPLPPYIERPLADPERYQTVYADRAGSVAAPTAGLHLSLDVLDRCRARGCHVATVDLAVGLATFRPVRAARAEDHVMHAERYDVPAATLAACAGARRVVAVGTTTVRALESAAATGRLAGETSLYVHGRYPFQVVDVLLTNFHQPRSSLLLLLEAFCGPRWRDLYAVALAAGYRFLSFGDAMLVGRRDDSL
ncbi:MAG TPA: tRNA preQ1(34) S-adenosylmethionine ribosyltransferase-isomerase QueA [Acidimicrobiales bacterium]|nr:tRNA preQ1(34) S-adenosylmethionine ribosyltransferase-isomerase QueA [Acidimicrobiales bacterium]